MITPIYIDVTSLFEQALTGIGRFVAQLVMNMAGKTPVRLLTGLTPEYVARTRLRTTLNCSQEIRLTPDSLPVGCVDLHRWRDDILGRPTVLHDASEARRSPVVYTFLRPAGGRKFAREVAILYDLTPIILPDTHQAETVEVFREYCCKGIHQHDAILAISESTRNDAEWVCGVSADRLAVGMPGPSQCIAAHLWRQPVTRRSDFALVVSTRQPRKNGQFLLEWFMSTEQLPHGFELHWAGPRGWLCDADEGPIVNPFGRRVRFLDMISDKQLCRLYRAAKFTVYPSLYEGFGFPVLDSLRHGAPVLCAYNSSLVDFNGPGVHYFDPCDTASLAAAYVEMSQTHPSNVVRPDLDELCNWGRVANQLIGLCHLN